MHTHTRTFILGEERPWPLVSIVGARCVYVEGCPMAGRDHLTNNRAKVPLLWSSLQRHTHTHTQSKHNDHNDVMLPQPLIMEHLTMIIELNKIIYFCVNAAHICMI